MARGPQFYKECAHRNLFQLTAAPFTVVKKVNYAT